MVLFIAYAFFVLFAVAKHRRRWAGLGYLVLGLAGVAGMGVFHYYLSVWTKGAVSLPLLQLMVYPYGGFIAVLSAFLFSIPRRNEAHACRRCDYDLTGQEESPVHCPECGLAHDGELHPSMFCGSCGGVVDGVGGRRCACPPPAPAITEEESLDRARKRRRAAVAILGTARSPKRLRPASSG
ncbi:MAG: hypothetical protein ACOYN0_09255 [Phycisphaerales bacterium]